MIIVTLITISYFFIEPAKPEITTYQSEQIEIANFAFNPDNITVKLGTAIVWINEDLNPHTIVSDDGDFNSNTLNKGDSFSVDFVEYGIFEYHCGIHPYMKGTIIVE